MSAFSVSALYGSHGRAVAEYIQASDEIVVGLGRRIKVLKVRTGVSKVLNIETESEIVSISAEKDTLLVLDESRKVYLYSLLRGVELGRMKTNCTISVKLVDGMIYMENAGYFEEWVVDPGRDFLFRKVRHIVGHQDSVHFIEKSGSGVLTGSLDGALREYLPEKEFSGDENLISVSGNDLKNICHVRKSDGKSVLVAKSKSRVLAARKIEGSLVIVYASGEIAFLVKMESAWEVTNRIFTRIDIKCADVSPFGNTVVFSDPAGNISLYNTQSQKTIASITLENVSALKFTHENWILVSGSGFTVWDPLSSSLLYEYSTHEQKHVSLRAETGDFLSANALGDVFVWCKTSTNCTRRFAHHKSAAKIVPLKRAFLSVSSDRFVLSKYTGEILKSKDLKITAIVADSDGEVLALASTGEMQIWDLTRVKLLQELSVELPVCISVEFGRVLLLSVNSISVFGVRQESISLQESVSAGCIESGRILCVGESGILYEYDEKLNEIASFRVLPEFMTKMGNISILGMTATKEEIILTYKIRVPDRITQFRDKLVCKVFHGRSELSLWTVSENAGNSSGEVRVDERGHIFICTDAGILEFSEREFPGGVWVAETPNQVRENLKKPENILQSFSQAISLEDPEIIREILEMGDPEVLCSYVPEQLLEKSVSLILHAISDGLAERGLKALRVVLQRLRGREGLERVRPALEMALRRIVALAHETTGFSDAIQEFGHLSG
ncbi:uncharacterized protein NEMAJ01_0802 [Nematocida major]|uniref:uncharacterized protein n=1 Tax=Nematocida major TaxID=1912982 RepID=UPI002007DAA0|nr:uncharacterized protein NEMAJ01_0802 [Nematocida major]KAH9385906.1 hypothetical protein NEMAJ01_0802 [Nematocida major]